MIGGRVDFKRVLMAREAVKRYIEKNEIWWAILAYTSSSGFSEGAIQFVKEDKESWEVKEKPLPRQGFA
jgi:hypothetical protein